MAIQQVQIARQRREIERLRLQNERERYMMQMQLLQSAIRAQRDIVERYK